MLSHTKQTGPFFLFLHATCTAYPSSCSSQCLHCKAPSCYHTVSHLLLPNLPTQHISPSAPSCYLHYTSICSLMLPTLHNLFCSLIVPTLYTSSSASSCYLHSALLPHAIYTTPSLLLPHATYTTLHLLPHITYILLCSLMLSTFRSAPSCYLHSALLPHAN
jgi:hypothetical protein